MIFLKPNDYLPKLNQVFDEIKKKVHQILPHAEVEHIGSSAIKDAISKGDLDILVRVVKKDFSEAIVKIQSLGFFIKEGTLRTESLCMFETKEFDQDVAVQLIESGSEFEDFIRFRDRLNAEPTLVVAYNEMKTSSINLSHDEYRAKKSDFIRSVLASSKIIYTSRLLLRPWLSSDRAAYINLCNSEGINDYSTGRFENMNLEKAKAWILAEQNLFQQSGLGRWGVFLKESNQPIGICGLYQMTDPQFIGVIGIAYRFVKSEWAQGYAAESASALIHYGFQSLKLKSISAITDATNTRSIRVAEKIGMKLEEAVLYKGESKQHWRILNL